MNKEEIKQYLKENLTVDVRFYGGSMEVDLLLEGETISHSESEFPRSDY